MTPPPILIFHDWIRDDLPIGIKMMITPQHVEKLITRIENYDMSDAFVRAFAERQPKDKAND